jgi:hypothetical protein
MRMDRALTPGVADGDDAPTTAPPLDSAVTQRGERIRARARGRVDAALPARRAHG